MDGSKTAGSVCTSESHTGRLELSKLNQRHPSFFLASFRSASQPSYGQNSRETLAYTQFTRGEQFQPGGVPQPVSLGSIRQVTTVEQLNRTRPATAEDDDADKTPANSSQPPKLSVRRLFRRAGRPTYATPAPTHTSAGPSEQPSAGRFGDLQLDPTQRPSFGNHTVITSQTALPPPRRRPFPFM